MQHLTEPSAPVELPALSEEAVQVRMMRELLTRTRESAMVGVLPVFLMVWSHWQAQPPGRLILWTAIALAVAACRVTVAHVFLCQPERQAARKRTWFWLEWLGAVALACIWVASLAMLGSGQTDALFYVRMIFIVALVAFVLSSMGIDMRIYASFLAATVGGALLQLHLYFPAFLADMPVAHLAFVIYAVMLLVRSRGEQRRTREWVRARLTQRNLLDQLNQNIRQELLMHESLRIKSLELEGSNRRLAELATRDGLTGAFRRGHIEGELGRLVKGLQRRPGDLSVLLMDLDKFKQVNDIHGHAVGDEVLRRTAAKAQDVLRASDLFGRWGGEEFIVLLPDTALAQALETAERLREAIGRLEFTGEGGATLRITVSIGAAQYEPGESADELARRADKALYAAKHAGRNRVMAYEPGQSWFSELQ